jgi:hypothetical protein
MKTLPKPGAKAKHKLAALTRRLIDDELKLKTAAFFSHRYPFYAAGLCQAVSADLRDIWHEFERIKKLVNRT